MKGNQEELKEKASGDRSSGSTVLLAPRAMRSGDRDSLTGIGEAFLATTDDDPRPTIVADDERQKTIDDRPKTKTKTNTTTTIAERRRPRTTTGDSRRPTMTDGDEDRPTCR